MSAFVWNANPEKWNIVPPATTSWDALRDYIEDQSNFVYWSTPVLRGTIQLGDDAIIWRTQYRNFPSGIIAVGTVAELPKDLKSGLNKFDYPNRVQAAGWSEATASSSWKTGIRLNRTLWSAPMKAPIKPSQGTVRTLTDAEVNLVQNALR